MYGFFKQRPLHRAWIAGGLAPCAALLLLPTGVAHAVTRTVTNCNNSGAGSLRATVAASHSGDVVSLAGLACGVINVTSGEITVPQASLEIVGRGRAVTTLRGTYGTHRVLRHTGIGTLTLRHLSVSYGRVEGPGASGGCIWSAGSVALRAARVHHCAAISALSNDPSGRGGGVYAAGDVLLSDASVFRNLANNQDFAGGGGGGVAAEGTITLQHSQVYENIDFGKGGGLRGRTVTILYSLVQDNASANGGGIYASDNLQVRKSTVTGNIAGFEGGALLSDGSGGVYESTISGNEAFNGVPGIRTYGSFLTVWMSTVVDNVSNTPDCGGALNAPRIVMYSTIAANNACFEGGPGADIGGPPEASFGGRHNLVESSARHVPFDTINADPMLGPLANNGGPTRTHGLLPGSPAIDKGSNPALRDYDQRGPGFPRVKGNGPDIGAFER